MKTAAAIAATLALAPAFAATAAMGQNAPFTPVLSTTMERVCTGETRQTALQDLTGQMPLNQPVVTRYTSGFHARAGRNGGYAFEQTAQNPAGNTQLRADIAADGAVSNARISGSSIEPLIAAGQINAAAFATTTANDIPERLVLGRSFRTGDPYYPPAVGALLLSQFSTAFGVPFPVQGSIDIVYRGRNTTRGRPSYNFTGTMSAQGAGQVQGSEMSLSMTSEVLITHDLETGLLLSSQNKIRTELSINGRLVRDVEHTDTLTCEVRPRQAS